MLLSEYFNTFIKVLIDALNYHGIIGFTADSVDIQVYWLASLDKSGTELAFLIQDNCVGQTKSQHDH